MLSHDPAALVDQVTRTAAYDTLREVANRLGGLLVARQLAADTDQEAQAWRREHLDLRDRLDEIQPGTPEVTETLEAWSRRLAELRGGTA